MKNFEVKYNELACYKELAYIDIAGTRYTKDQLSFESNELLSIMAYYDYEDTIEYFDNISQLLGYDTVLQGILDLNKLGAGIASASVYRKLVMNSFKKKHKGLMR